jgi:hypothetical protein
MPAAAERHDGIASALHIATDTMHRPQQVFDSVGAGERTAQRTLIAVPGDCSIFERVPMIRILEAVA